MADTDTAQFLYTSGTTSRPKAAIMSHRALVHEYVSCIVALDLAAEDNPLHVMPLYHSAQMHVFLVPWLAVGATNTILEVPDAAEVLRRIEQDGHRAFFAAPTLWVAMANHADFETRDLGGLVKAYYGASIMPVPVLQRIQAKAPSLGLQLLRPVRDRPARNGPASRSMPTARTQQAGRSSSSRPGSSTAPNDVASGETGEIVYRSPQLCDDYWNDPRATERRLPEAGSTG